jgi:hypothetical protein
MKFIRASRWLDVSGVEFEEAANRAVKGSFVKVLPSPFDLPVGMRTVLLERGRSQLELKYLSNEPLVHGTYHDGAEITYGRKSYRPHTISVGADAERNPVAYMRKVEAALDSFVRVYAVGSALSPIGSIKLRSNITCIKSMLRSNVRQLCLFDPAA